MCLSKVWENGRLLEKLQIPVCRGHHAEHQDQTGKTQYLMSGSCDYWNKEKENLSFSYIRDQDVNKKWLTHVQRRAPRAHLNRPTHFCPLQNVLFFDCLFWLMSASAKRLHLFFHPSFYHPNTLSSLPGPSSAVFFTQDSFQAAHLQTQAGMLSQLVFDSEEFLREICVLLRLFQPFPGMIWVLN